MKIIWKLAPTSKKSAGKFECVCARMCVHVSLCACVCVCVCPSLCMNVSACLYLCVHGWICPEVTLCGWWDVILQDQICVHFTQFVCGCVIIIKLTCLCTFCEKDSHWCVYSIMTCICVKVNMLTSVESQQPCGHHSFICELSLFSPWLCLTLMSALCYIIMSVLLQ